MSKTWILFQGLYIGTSASVQQRVHHLRILPAHSKAEECCSVQIWASGSVPAVSRSFTVPRGWPESTAM